MYTSIIGNANNDLKNIQAILVTLRDNGKHSAIPPTFREYEPTYGSTLDSIVRKWEGIGISPIAATSACFLGKKPSNRSEVDAITLFHQMLEMVKSQEDLNMGAKKFVDKCITYIKTFVQFAARDNHKVLGFYTTGCINSLGNMWDFIKNFHVPHPIKVEGSFTVAMLRDHLREFKMRPHGGDLRGVNQSVPADNAWLSATRKRDELLNLTDPNVPLVISFRASHRELHYLTLDASWESLRAQRLEWVMQVVGLGHAWRCHNHLKDDMGNPVEPITLETTITDLIEQKHKLTRERAAAVNHLTCILALSPMFAKCKTKLERLRAHSQKAREREL